jgi:hypothetical protein
LRPLAAIPATAAPCRQRLNNVLAGISYHHDAVPVFVVERSFAEELELSSEDLTRIDEINADEGIRWLFSFLSADRRQMYCLYQAPCAVAITAAARKANIPADAIVELEPDALGLPGRLHDWAASQP